MSLELDLDDGARAADSILREAYGVEIVEKALNPLKRKDYDTIVARLSRALARVSRNGEQRALNRALDALDVDWATLTQAGRNRVVAAASQVLRSAPSAFIAPVTREFKVYGQSTMRGARAGTRAQVAARFRANIGISLSQRDQRILDHAVSSQALFVRDEWGRRSASFSDLSRRIVADGLKDGLGRDEIAENLSNRLTTAVGINRSRAYWDVIAGAFANRSRSYAQLSSYSEANIRAFIFEAVLDERTTDICASLHDRRFEVGAGLERYDRVEAAEDPESVRDLMPWVRVGRDEDGKRVMFTQDREGNRTTVGEIVRSRVGNRDDLGEYRGMRSNGELQEMGAFIPPLHGLCRSTIVPDV